MQGVFAATMAEFVEFKPIWIVTTVLFCGVITLLAFGASEVDHLTYIFLSHIVLLP
jgi:hypothetical protein